MMKHNNSEKDFLEAIDVNNIKSPNKKEAIFKALFNVCGTEFTPEDFPEKGANPENDKLRLSIEAAKKKIFIKGYINKIDRMKANGQYEAVADNLIAPQKYDFMVIAMDAYTKAGGKLQDFQSDINYYRGKYQQDIKEKNISKIKEKITKKEWRKVQHLLKNEESVRKKPLAKNIQPMIRQKSIEI